MARSILKTANCSGFPEKIETACSGNGLNRHVNIEHEIFNKIHEVRKTWCKLLQYWKATNANIKWRLIIFDAVIRPTLFYGLETVQLTGAILKKVDAFQLRCLRKILKTPSAFIDRRYFNRVVSQRCTELLFANQGGQREFEVFSHSYLQDIQNIGSCKGQTQKTPCIKFLFNPTVSSGRSVEQNELVAQSKIGCVMQKTYIRTYLTWLQFYGNP